MHFKKEVCDRHCPKEWSGDYQNPGKCSLQENLDWDDFISRRRERHKDFNKSNNSFHELRVSVFHCAFFSFLSQLELYFNFFFFHASTVVYLVSCALLLLCSCQAYPRDCVCHLCKAVSCGRSSSCDSISCQPLGFLIINTITLQFENSKVFLTKS